MTYLYNAQAIKGWPYHVSAGGLVFKNDNDKRLYALLYRGIKWQNEESWHLPKGTMLIDETILGCATREVKEEAGLTGKLWGYLGAITRSESWTGGHYEKTTHYLLFEWQTGDGSKMDKEHDRLEWYDAKEAFKKLSLGRTGKIKAEQSVVERAEKLLAIISKPPRYE